MKQLDRIDSEFTRQASTFLASATLRSADLTERIADALGVETGGRVLDVACGPGILTAALGAHGAKAVGIDFTLETLRLARGRTRDAAFARALGEDLPFPDACFGAAALRLALHHFEHPERVLGEVRRVLTHGGRLAVLDILTSANAAEARLHEAIERLRDPSHVAFTTEPALQDLIARRGFVIESARSWELDRSFEDWASIVNAPERMEALEVLLRHLARAGNSAGIALREQDGSVWFTYRFALVLARAA